MYATAAIMTEVKCPSVIGHYSQPRITKIRCYLSPTARASIWQKSKQQTLIHYYTKNVENMMVEITSNTTAMDSTDNMDMSVIGAALRNEKIGNALSISIAMREHRQQHPSSEMRRRSRSLGRSMPVKEDGSPVVETPTPKPRESRSLSRNNPSSHLTKRSKSVGRWLGLRKLADEEEDVPAGEESKPSESKPSRESRSSSRYDPSAPPTRWSNSTARSNAKGPRWRSKEDPSDSPPAEGKSKPKSRESRSSSRNDDQSSKMTRSKSLVRMLCRRNPAGEQEDVTAEEESNTSESKPSRESRSSSRNDSSAPTKRSKSTVRSKSKGPIGRSKEDPLEASPTKRMRTIIRMSAKELIEAGFDPKNIRTRPKSPRTSKGGKERIRVPGLDAKDMAARVLVKRKSKKKVKDAPKEIPMEVEIGEPSLSSEVSELIKV